MPPDNYLRNNCVYQFSIHKLGLFVLLVFVITSCTKTETTSTSSDYSDAFNVIYRSSRIYDVRKAEQGMQYLDSAFNHLSSPTINDRFRFYALHFLYYKKMTTNRVKELAYADSMMLTAAKCIKEKQYVLFFSESNFAKGDAYFDAQHYNEAYKYFYAGYFLGKNHFNSEILAEYTYRMGMISFKQSQFKTAANYFKDSYKQSLSVREDFAPFYRKQELLNDIGESYQHNGDIDSALVYFNRNLAYIDQNSQKYRSRDNLLDVARAVTYGDMGLISYSKGKYTQAADEFKKSIVINLKRANDNYNAELVEISLGQLYLNQRQDNLFINLMNDLRSQLDSVKNTEAETDWNRLMSDYYVKKKEYSKSFTYFKNYSALKDSLNNLATSLKETDINQQLANYDKQYQIESLKGDNKLQLIYLYLAIICVIMAVIIIFLVFRNWKRSKKDILVISDLNKQISSQKVDLETTLNELKVNSQEKDRILRTVAHDLRNPIGGIVSLTNSMLEDEYNEDQKQLISLVNGTSHNSLELINEILEATNNTTGKLNKEPVEINTLVNDSVEILSFKAAEKDQQIVTGLLDHPKKLLVSRERIWRVISNLISNAIKFSPSGTTIRVNVANGDNAVTISVADEGIGIPDHIKDEVFNIFTDAKRPGTAGERSFGLGLSICQQIIENHNGKIWFESNSGRGTTFYIRLPAV